MKNKTILLLVAMSLGIFLNSCKKGADDPFISLSSRDARITAEWVLVSAEMTADYSINVQGTAYEISANYVYDGTTVTATMTYSGTTNTETYSFAQTMNIKKDGTYDSETTVDGEKTLATKLWWWNNSDDRKSGIILDEFQGFTDFDLSGYNIERLASKELTLTVNASTVNTVDGVDYPQIIEQTLKFQKKAK